MALQSGQRFCSHNDHENSFCCNLWGKAAGRCLNNLESSSCLACCDVYGWNSKSIDIRFARQCKASGQYSNISYWIEVLYATYFKDSKREIGGSRVGLWEGVQTLLFILRRKVL